MILGWTIVGVVIVVIIDDFRREFLEWWHDGEEVPEIVEPPKTENKYMEGDEKA